MEGEKWAYEDVVLDEVGVALRLKVEGALLLEQAVEWCGSAAAKCTRRARDVLSRPRTRSGMRSWPG